MKNTIVQQQRFLQSIHKPTYLQVSFKRNLFLHEEKKEPNCLIFRDQVVLLLFILTTLLWLVLVCIPFMPLEESFSYVITRFIIFFSNLSKLGEERCFLRTSEAYFYVRELQISMMSFPSIYHPLLLELV